jgi:hypothetical protein
MSHLRLDVTDLSDAAFDVYLTAAAGGVVDVTHLTVTERYWVARALGQDTTTPAVAAWCHTK